MCTIETLNGRNFDAWKSDLEIALGLANLDLALIEDEPADLTTQSTADERRYSYQWKRANRLCIMVIKRSISPAFKISVPDEQNAKKYLQAISEKFKASEKAETGELMDKLCNLKYDGLSGIRAHILKMQDVADHLNSLKITITESFLVHKVLHSLPPQFGQLKTVYNTLKEEWNLNQLISVCVQEEERLKKEKEEGTVVSLIHHSQEGK